MSELVNVGLWVVVAEELVSDRVGATLRVEGLVGDRVTGVVGTEIVPCIEETREKRDEGFCAGSVTGDLASDIWLGRSIDGMQV